MILYNSLKVTKYKLIVAMAVEINNERNDVFMGNEKKAINFDSNLDKTAFLDAPRPCRKECHALETNIDLMMYACLQTLAVSIFDI